MKTAKHVIPILLILAFRILPPSLCLKHCLSARHQTLVVSTALTSCLSQTITSDADRATVGSAPEDFEAGNRHGQWLRRRKIDGALNRVPSGFYKRLYQLLLRCRTLSIQNMTLDVSLTYEMTSGETKFALAVERIMNTIPTPEYRQLLVEALVMLGMLNEVDKKLAINLSGQTISVDHLVSQAHQYFLKDQVSCCTFYWRLCMACEIHPLTDCPQAEYGGDSILCCANSTTSAPTAQQGHHVHNSDYSDSDWAPGGALTCRRTHGLCVHFYDTAPSGRYGTITYLVRALSSVIPIPTNERGHLPPECLQQ